MSDYASLTVAQLKELLKGKNLPVDGKKADLVARLTEAGAGNELDEPKDAVEGTEAATDSAVEASAADASAAEASTSEPVETAESTEATESTEADKQEQKEKKPEKKVLTPEEIKQLAVDLLTKKIKRAEKFGDEALAQEARANLARVEKFGVDPSTALAKEIGATNRGINSELKPPKRRGGYKNGARSRKKSKN
ncbi:CIC11C00000004008 [Sungouiella intermedia]|uniref:CIC11C00000004008 n=1 Tax=Sungouiella intermedia TaxID=45354 RepID=A0A1L0GQX5_9ASCO|nr:CIC11C00000004008 [[Candida] intermedia]